jgi:DNA-binding transcriptional LysR family regulator
MDAEISPLDPLPSRELAAFVAAVETGRLGAAADALALTQSAITKRIQSLERRVGRPLLFRSHQGVRPTRAGQALYPQAKEGLAALSRGASAVAEETVEELAQLRLAATQTIAQFLLPAWLTGFRLQLPEVRPRVDVFNSPGVVRAVRDRRAQIGLVPHEEPIRGLESIPVGHDELVVVVGANHRWAGARTIDSRDLASEPFFGREEESGTESTALAAIRKLGLELVPQLEFASAEALKRVVLQEGFTIISSLAVEEEVRAGSLHALSVRRADLGRTFWAVRPRQGRLPGGARQFWRWLTRLCQAK